MLTKFCYKGTNYTLEEFKAYVNSNPSEFAGYIGENATFDSSLGSSNVEYEFRAINILSSDKAAEIFKKGEKNNWTLEKILNELQVPKQQKQLLLNLGTNDREELITNFLANNSYTVEINTAKDMVSYRVEPYTEFDPDTYENEFVGYAIYTPDSSEPKYIVPTKEEAERLGKQEGRNTQHYSNLTVPGGTAYTENEISTPLITPSIKGHAQFSTDNGIGWFRSDDLIDKVTKFTQTLDGVILTYELIDGTWTSQYEDGDRRPISEDKIKDILSKVKGNMGRDFDIISEFTGNLSKTRRILEVQSDLFQKGRDIKSPDEVIEQLKKEGKLQIKCD